MTAPALTSRTDLTARQTEILQAIADGDTSDEIADALFLTRTAVNSTMHYIRIKLRAGTTPEAVATALRKRIIT